VKAGLTFILSLAFILILSTTTHGQYFNCIEVDEDGDIRLEWSAPVPQSEFGSYQVYRKNDTGNFGLVHTIDNYNDTTWLDNQSNGEFKSYTYYISTQTSQNSIVSDTLSSIYLRLAILSLDPDVILLEWTAIKDPLPVSYDTEYNIVMNTTEFPAFATIDSTDQLNYTMPITICQSGVSFRIEIGHESGCTSRSNITYDVLGDSYAPPMPRLDSVSIDLAGGNVIMGWSPSSATDAEKYYIYHDENNINDIYDTVFGRLNTFYADDLFDPCSKNRGWAISAEDSCGNIGPGTYDIPQRTILLDPVDFNPCTMVNRLNWSQYINMVPELQGYYVYLSTDGSPFELQATVFDSVTYYEHQGLDPDRNYRYFIRAFSTGSQVTSTSCIQELNTWQYRRPVENKMENASVENSDYVNLAFLPDTFAYVPYLRIYRSEDSNGPWAMIGEAEINGQSGVYYDDETADVNSTSYYYYSTIIDSCGNEVLESDPFRTIFLDGEQGDLQNMLEWNAFEGWPGGVSAYEVFRAVGDEGFISIDDVGGNMLSYTDDISFLPGDFNLVRYLIRALNDGNDSLESWSNIKYFEYNPRIYLPNAFRPGGNNPVYKPVGNFAKFADYRMEIYNRWGALVFSSDTFGDGWDGTIEGSDAPGGVYVCKLVYKSSGGRTETLKTTLVLLR